VVDWSVRSVFNLEFDIIQPGVLVKIIDRCDRGWNRPVGYIYDFALLTGGLRDPSGLISAPRHHNSGDAEKQQNQRCQT
jgi:hypothetical protein